MYIVVQLFGSELDMVTTYSEAMNSSFESVDESIMPHYIAVQSIWLRINAIESCNVGLIYAIWLHNAGRSYPNMVWQ